MDNPLEAGSPPLAQPDEAPRQLPTLPTEILQRIIQLALPRISFTTFRERYDVLLKCCRVNKLWAALAQVELYRHVSLTEKRAAIAFGQGKRPPSLKSLRLLVDDDEAQAAEVPTPHVRTLLEATSRLEMLQVVAARDCVGPPRVHLEALSAALDKGLKDLTIDYCPFISTPDDTRLVGKTLRRLTLSFQTSATIASLLLLAQLPHLNTLLLVHSNPPEPGAETRALEHALLAHTARLTSFALAFNSNDSHYTLRDGVWTSFKTLGTLMLDCNAPMATILPLLSKAPLAHLRLRLPWDLLAAVNVLSGIYEALSTTPETRGSLRRLAVPAFDGDEGAARESLADLCSKRDIELVERPSFEHDHSVQSLEDALEDW